MGYDPEQLRLPNISIFIIGLIWVLYSFFFSGFGEWNQKNLFRYSTAFLLFACITPYIIRISGQGSAPLIAFNKKYLKPYHAHMGTISFLIMIRHGFYEGRCNTVIELAVIVFSFLFATGLALYLKRIPPDQRRRAYILHSHHLLVFFLFAMVIIGHILEEL